MEREELESGPLGGGSHQLRLSLEQSVSGRVGTPVQSKVPKKGGRQKEGWEGGEPLIFTSPLYPSTLSCSLW